MIGKRLKKIIQLLIFIFYKSKQRRLVQLIFQKKNSNDEKQIILLVIPNEEREAWHYLAVKKVSISLRGTKSKRHDHFYCLNCLHSFRTESKLKSHEKVCKNKEFCGIVMRSEKDNISEINQYMMKSDKMQYLC